MGFQTNNSFCNESTRRAFPVVFLCYLYVVIILAAKEVGCHHNDAKGVVRGEIHNVWRNGLRFNRQRILAAGYQETEYPYEHDDDGYPSGSGTQNPTNSGPIPTQPTSLHLVSNAFSFDAVERSSPGAWSPSSAPLTSTMAAPTTLQLSLEEIAKHGDSSDCWTAVHGGVYDVTIYGPMHPGGKSRIWRMCGHDATDLFHGHHPFSYLQMFPQVKYLGPLSVPSPAPTTSAPITKAPTTSAPITKAPTTPLPTTKAPTTSPPTTNAPATENLTAPPSPAPTPKLTSDMASPTANLPAPLTSTTAAPTTLQLSLKEIAKHGDSSDCWTAVHGGVYDVTMYGPMHPGGKSRIWSMCGHDATDLFHGHHPFSYLQMFPQVKYLGPLYVPTSAPTASPPTTQAPTIGSPSPTAPPSPPPTPKLTSGTAAPTTNLSSPTAMSNHSSAEPHDSVSSNYPSMESSSTGYPSLEPSLTILPSLEHTAGPTTRLLPNASPSNMVALSELRGHSNTQDCWVSYYNQVYDLTYFAPDHPGGASFITQNCGADGTKDFRAFHQQSMLSLVKDYYVGDLNTNADNGQQGSSSSSNTPNTNTNSDTNSNTNSNSVTTSNPVVQSSSAFTTTQSPQTQAPTLPNGMVSLHQLQQHKTPKDCWVSYYDEVYDLTHYANKHPGGALRITANCGKDATHAFQAFHSRSMLNLVQQYFMGKLDMSANSNSVTTLNPVVQSGSAFTTTTTQSPQTQAPTLPNGMVSLHQLQQHKTQKDCWVSYYDKVYDLTHYANKHPGGASLITANCGEDATHAFQAFHSRSMLNLVQQYFMGKLDMSVATEAGGSSNATSSSSQNKTIVAMTMEDIAKHNSFADCYVKYEENVYDLTYYSHPNPPGMPVIHSSCGKDGTRLFRAAHPRRLLDQVEGFKVGYVEGASSSSMRSKGSWSHIGNVCWLIFSVLIVIHL